MPPEDENETRDLVDAALRTEYGKVIKARINEQIDKWINVVDAAAANLVAGKPPAPPRHKSKPQQQKPSGMTEAEARQVLHIGAGTDLTEDLVKRRKKVLAGMAHPDVAGGSTEAQTRINVAADVLLKLLRRAK